MSSRKNDAPESVTAQDRLKAALMIRSGNSSTECESTGRLPRPTLLRTDTKRARRPGNPNAAAQQRKSQQQ
eukprot:665219-Rhodomonas_salina.2